MSSALIVVLFLSAQPATGCAATVESCSEHRLCKLKADAHYYKRLYYGHYDRHPFDYRFQFDYPWQAGPSQEQWPIVPLPAADIGAWENIEFEAQRPGPSRRVSIAARPSTPVAEPAAGRTSLKLHHTPALLQ
jgi:hypothetical protein